MEEKRGEAEDSIANKLILKRAVDTKIRRIRAKAFISEKEVYDLIRGFFKKYLEIDYEFTTEELMKELRRIYVTADVQEELRKMLDRLSEIEHLSREFPKEELDSMLSDFEGLVSRLIISHYEKHSLLKKIGDGLHRLFSVKHREVFEQNDPVMESESVIVRMNMLLDNAKRLSDKDITRAKEEYHKLMEIYDTLDDDKKKNYYEAVNALYQMIKSKE